MSKTRAAGPQGRWHGVALWGGGGGPNGREGRGAPSSRADSGIMHCGLSGCAEVEAKGEGGRTAGIAGEYAMLGVSSVGIVTACVIARPVRRTMGESPGGHPPGNADADSA